MTGLEESFSVAPGVTIISGDSSSTAVANEAAMLAGGRVLSTISWADAAEHLSRQASLRLVIAETRDVADEVLAAGIEAVASAVRGAGARLIVTLDEAQIDLVAGQLVDGDTWLLCKPTLTDRVAAAAIALNTCASTLHDVSREAARLDRLNEEVARIAETLARLTRRDDIAAAAPAIVGERTMPYGAAPAAEHATGPGVAAGEIRQTIRARRMRGEMFGVDGLFEDPAWDMLLDLFAARIEHRRVSVSSLCIAAAVAPTTALRWIGKLIEFGLLDRHPDAFDRRRAFIALSDRAAGAMSNYVGAVKRAGLPIA